MTTTAQRLASRRFDVLLTLAGLLGLILLSISPYRAIKWLRQRARPAAPVLTPQIGFATLDDIDRLTALSIQDADWLVWLNDPSVAAAVPRHRVDRSPDSCPARARAKSVQATVEARNDRGIVFFAGQGWRQRVRVYSRSLLPPEAKPKGWRSMVRGWYRRLKSVSID